MLNNFIFSINAVLPVFIIILLGFGLKVKGVLDEAIVKKLNFVSFYYAVPFLLFRDIYNSDLNIAFDPKFVMYAVLTTFACCILVWAIGSVFIKDKPTLGSFVQGCFRGNYAIIGLPLVASVLGDLGTGKSAIITTFIVPIYNVLAVTVLTLNSGKANDGSIKRALVNIAKNPLILGIVCGLPFTIFNIRLPQFIMGSIDYMAGLATPLALIGIGASISIGEVKETMKLTSVVTVVKLVIVPILFISLAILLGIRSAEELVILYVMYASPTAINSYIMASTMGANDKLAANIVIMTTFVSAFTFTFGVFLFKTLGLV